MADDPQRRFEEALAVDARLDSPAREGLTGTARGDIYGPARDPESVTVPPDARPMSAQPKWRQDFAIDWPQDHYVARRDFARFMVLTSGAFVVGQGWVAASSLVRSRRPALPRVRIASAAATAAGTATVFRYPSESDPCLLIRTGEGELVAFSQLCTHLSCAVVPNFEEGVLHCPCHEGYFDLATGVNIAGPPPRPLPVIELELDGDDVYAVGVRTRAI